MKKIILGALVLFAVIGFMPRTTHAGTIYGCNSSGQSNSDACPKPIFCGC